MAENSREKILIAGPSWVGDMDMSQSLYRALKKINPETHISVSAQGGLKPLLERMPEVDDILKFSLRHGELKLSERRTIGETLREKNSTKPLFYAYLLVALVPWHALIPERLLDATATFNLSA